MLAHTHSARTHTHAHARTHTHSHMQTHTHTHAISFIPIPHLQFATCQQQWKGSHTNIPSLPWFSCKDSVDSIGPTSRVHVRGSWAVLCQIRSSRTLLPAQQAIPHAAAVHT